MIRDKLIPLLEEKFGAVSFFTGIAPDPIVIFPATHADVGELRIWDDGDEATVEIGAITHGHFGSFTSNTTQEDIAQDEVEQDVEQEVAELVTEFVGDLFAGKYVLWRSKYGGAGGWWHIDYAEENTPLSYVQEDATFFIWSGPLQPESR